MLRNFDSVLVSSDLSLERVLQAGLPVALVFYDRVLSPDLRQTMDKLAGEHSGKALIVMLARDDAPQASSRFGIRQFPSLVTLREGKIVANVNGVGPADLQPHVAYLLGEGPRPAASGAQPEAPSVRTNLPHPIPVNEADFEREVLRADRPVLVDFWAPWCAPCRMVEPTVAALAREQGKSLKVVKVNVDENSGLASRYNAMSIPTMIVIKGGREVDRWVGALPESAIRNRVARWI